MALIEVEADGLVGYGESWINHPPWAASERLATLGEGVAPLLLGQPIDEPARTTNILLNHLLPIGRQWGAIGPIVQAVSGVDIALWDLHAKHLGLPLANVLGGYRRDKVHLYASSLGPSNVRETAQKCRDFRVVKVRVGFGPDVDQENLVTAREVLGTGTWLAVDANQRWTLSEAVASGDLLREIKALWVEEPIAGNAVAELVEFHRRTGLPVAIGENLYLAESFEPYADTQAVPVLQPDVSKTGGLSHALRVVELAVSAGKAVWPHLYTGAVAYLATLHLAAACPGVSRIEYDVRENPLRDPLMRDPPRRIGDVVVVPRSPGLGVDLDFDCVDALTVAEAQVR